MALWLTPPIMLFPLLLPLLEPATLPAVLVEYWLVYALFFGLPIAFGGVLLGTGEPRSTKVIDPAEGD